MENRTEIMKTAVEWLVNQMKAREALGLTVSIYDLEMFAEQAKEMEKDQIQNAYSIGFTHKEVGLNHQPEKHYSKTFKSE